MRFACPSSLLICLTLLGLLALGCSCSEERAHQAGTGDPKLDAAGDTVTTDVAPERDAPAGADADSGPAGPTRGDCGQTAWSKRFGASPADRAIGDERAAAVAVAPGGDVLVTGWYHGDADFGGGPLAIGGANPLMFVVRLAPDGNHRFSRGFGDPTPGVLTTPHARGRGVAFAADGSALVAGQFAGTVDFGKGALSSRELPADGDAGTDARLAICVVCQPDAVVLKLDAAGSTLWARHFGDDGADVARAVASSSGNAIVAGSVEGTVDFGGGNTSSSGRADAFVAALDASGAYVWALRLSGTGDDDANGVAIDSSGYVFVVGAFTETLSIGTTVLSSPGRTDAFIAKLDPSGTPLWAKQLGATELAIALGVAVDAQGAAVVVGGYRGSIDAGGGALQSAFDDAFVIKLDTGGNHVFMKRFGGAQNDEADAVAVDAQGRVFVTGAIGSDGVDFGGGAISGGRSDDLFLLTLDAAGEHECSRRYGSADGSSGGLGLAVDSDGNAVVGGALSGSVDLGAGRLSSTGGLDVLLAKFMH
jgi:hypothetical protein